MTLKDAVRQAPDSFLILIAKLPSTNFRIFATLLMAMWTCGHYVTSSTWQPSFEWLGFLVAMSGLDVAQFTAKRKTQTPDGTGE